jgi:hypothetical protein
MLHARLAPVGEGFWQGRKEAEGSYGRGRGREGRDFLL